MSALILAVPMAYDVVRVAGALYLAWLAWQTWRTPTQGGSNAVAPLPYARLWRDGAATGILNPKVALFQLALFPQFIDPSQGSILAQSLMLGAMQLAIVASLDTLWVVAASHVRGVLRGTPGWMMWSRRLLAGVFATLAVRLMLDERR